jgi:hypothetical protein
MMNLAEYRRRSHSLADFLPWAATILGGSEVGLTNSSGAQILPKARQGMFFPSAQFFRDESAKLYLLASIMLAKCYKAAPCCIMLGITRTPVGSARRQRRRHALTPREILVFGSRRHCSGLEQARRSACRTIAAHHARRTQAGRASASEGAPASASIGGWFGELPARPMRPRNYLGSGPGGPPGVPAGGITGMELGSGTGAGCTICGSTPSAGLMTPPLLSNFSLRLWFPSEVAFPFCVPPSAGRDKSFSGIV